MTLTFISETAACCSPPNTNHYFQPVLCDKHFFFWSVNIHLVEGTPVHRVLRSERSLELRHHNQSSSYLVICFAIMDETLEMNLPSGEGALRHLTQVTWVAQERLWSPQQLERRDRRWKIKALVILLTYCMLKWTTLFWLLIAASTGTSLKAFPDGRKGTSQ